MDCNSVMESQQLIEFLVFIYSIATFTIKFLQEVKRENCEFMVTSTYINNSRQGVTNGIFDKLPWKYKSTTSYVVQKIQSSTRQNKLPTRYTRSNMANVQAFLFNHQLWSIRRSKKFTIFHFIHETHAATTHKGLIWNFGQLSKFLRSTATPNRRR